jgi:hypothetical protein
VGTVRHRHDFRLTVFNTGQCEWFPPFLGANMMTCARCYRTTSHVRRGPTTITQCAHPSRSPTSRGKVPHATTVCTSEFWYEEEDEFDSIKDELTPKHLILVTAPLDDVPALRTALQPVPLTACFSGEHHKQTATELWAGRDGAPYFLKVKRRRSLDDGAAAELLTELLEQNWRVALDYGLGVEVPTIETLLIVCDDAAASRVVVACVNEEQDVQRGAITVVSVAGKSASTDPTSWQALGKTLAGVNIKLGTIEATRLLDRLTKEFIS